MALELFGISGDAKPATVRQETPSPVVAPRRSSDGRSRRLKPASDESQDLWAEFAPALRETEPAPATSGDHREPAPAEPLDRVLQPASFSHPRANREVLLGHARVAYALQRVRRRSIGFVVDADGLSVRAPSWVTLSAIDEALKEKSGWILRKLGDAQLRQQKREDARIEWKNGAVFPFLGEPLRIVLDAEHRFAGRGGALLDSALPGEPRELHIALPHAADASKVRDAVQAWLLRQARAHFVARLDHFAPQLGVRWTRLRLSSAQTRWGSARSDGSICLNWRLLHFRPSVIDYVVVHELSHLRVMDHSPRFWDTVGSVMPEYKALRRSLKEQATPSWE
ncbi:M48 family metallopeptidase [Diaphorobacter aerolatus]|uniref:M48 family metallopeptidase n=1 Tax=Diaphorobacter aerolatus TaxID=1288495 RepID=A0A7H0GNW1_9BURK|nr:SprT family zinc-dependent metalloprotease [Diaphorobacter aerolatus]QNP49977.1 M48 family metallopeptidase [Diaphorobacter aerolatus]